tara:strand:+ start:15383 stop:15574 length:192 start_codon:yes stop_codon:yes gene_type:complete
MNINPPEIDAPRMADACAQLQGCFNGDIFKFGPVVAGILIAAEVLFWASLMTLIVKRVKKWKK